MDSYRELGERLRGLHRAQTTLYQGVVTHIDGKTCTVHIDGIDIPDVRLRASTKDAKDEYLIIPTIGSPVIVGSLTGDLSGQMVILTIDEVDTITWHGAQKGGVVLVGQLTEKLNSLEKQLNDLKQVFQAWTPIPQDGGASLKTSIQPWIQNVIQLTQAEELENTKIKQ